MTKAMPTAVGPYPPEAEFVENGLVEVAGMRQRLRVTDLRDWTRRTLPVVSRILARLEVRPSGAPVTVLRPCDDGGLDATVGYPVDRMPWGTQVEHVIVPAGEAARAVHQGPYESLVVTYDRLFEWIVGHGRTPRPLMWEQYVVGPPATPAPEAWRTIVSCPLAGKASTVARGPLHRGNLPSPADKVADLGE